MRYHYRLIILLAFIFSNSASAMEFFLEGIDWRATESNDWAYANSEILPNQTIGYKTIDFTYSPGFRVGAIYTSTWDALLSYTRFNTTGNDSATGHIRPSFSGSVTASPTGYLFRSGQVHQSIDYNIFDLDAGKQFNPAASLIIHPIIGLMGGTINQSIHAIYRGSISTNENISNDFTGIGPKAGVDISINLLNQSEYEPKLIVAFASSYLLGHWSISDVTSVNPPRVIVPGNQPTSTINVKGVSHSLGALTLQGLIGMKVEHKNLAVKIAYEIGDWFNQSQFFDNDTGTHNNDLILQGLTLGISYRMD